MKNRLYHLDSEIQFYELQKRNHPTVFIFSAVWCPDCIYLNTFLADVINEYSQFDFIYVDRDEFIDICIDYDILGIPSLLAYQDGKELGRFVSKNRKTKKEIEAFLGELL